MDKIKLKNKAKFLKTQKLFIKIIIMVIIFFLLGTLYIAIISKSNKDLIENTLNNFFKEIKNNNLNYTSSLFNSLISYSTSGIFIWLLGISIIGIPIILIFLSFKSFIVGFSFSSLIYFYKFKGLLVALIYTLPLIFNLLILIILSFFSIRFSKRLMKVVFYKQDYSLRRNTKRYLKILFISEILLTISSIIETFLIPYFLKLISI